MARITSAASPIEGADLRQETTIQKGPAQAVYLDLNGKFTPKPLAFAQNLPATMTAKEGANVTMNVFVKDGQGPYTYEWYYGSTKIDASINPSAATNALINHAVTGASSGNYKVIAKDKTANTVTSATCALTVEVTPVPVTGVTIAPKTATLSLAGTKTQQLTPTIAPTGATDKAVTYVSADPTKATVSASGLVTGVAVGTTTITVTTHDGSKTDTCAVTVTA